MCLVGELGNGEQVDETEALRGLPLAPLGVDPRKGDVVMGDPADLGIALHSQQGENQTLSIVGTLLWLFTWFLHFSEFILNHI